jgi:hypothetical protein
MTWARQNFQTTEKAPAAILQAAATALEFSHRTTGTYAGAKTESVTLVWADQSRYCIEFGGQHIAGPSGTPTPGDCPR